MQLRESVKRKNAKLCDDIDTDRTNGVCCVCEKEAEIQ